MFFLLSATALAQIDDDGDGIVTSTCVCTMVDNCPFVPNPDQSDCDSDGMGDVCDTEPGCADTETDSDTETDTPPELPPGCSPMPGGDIFYFDSQVIANVQSILSLGATLGRDAGVFTRAGDSHTARPNENPASYFMGNCAYPWGADPQSQIKNVDCYPHLFEMVDEFSGPVAGGVSPFVRVALTAVGGKPSSWLVNSPEIIDAEIAAIEPAYVFIMFGTNDPQTPGLTEGDTVNNVMLIAAYFAARGVVPVVVSPPVHPTEIAYMQTVAAGLQAACDNSNYPFVDFHAVSHALPDFGLRPSPSVHLATARWDKKCVFAPTEAWDSGEMFYTLSVLRGLYFLWELAQ